MYVAFIIEKSEPTFQTYIFRLVLQLLLTKRPDQVDLPGEWRKTPLHCAALIDNIDAAKILVNRQDLVIKKTYHNILSI